MPNWLSAVWVVMIFIACLADEKFVKSQVVAYSALAVFILNYLIVLYAFIPNTLTSNLGWGGTSLIRGQQGRYLTPVFVVLGLFFANEKFKTRFTYRSWFPLLLIVVVIFSNFLMYYNTMFGLIYMGL
jgi:uncharacterized membrane protein